MAGSSAGRGRTLSKPELERLAHFRYQLRRFLRFSEEAARTHGVTSLQYLLLLQIGGYPGRDRASVGELAERLQARHHGVVSLVSRCVAAGLVMRCASAVDRRRVEVVLTRKGADVLDRLAKLHREELRSLDAVPRLEGRRSKAGGGPGATTSRAAARSGRR